MRKIKFILSFIIYFLSFIIYVNAQNLVPNPSFEDYNNCTPIIDGPFMPSYNGLKNWINPTMTSPDYDNICYSISDSAFHVPQNIAGYQIPKTGVAYADIDVCTVNPSFHNWEYIETKLVDSLLTGKKYCVSFYVSLADSMNYAIDNIGLYLSDTLVSISTNYNLPFMPQILNPQNLFLTDKKNWILISGEYIAHGGEKYITIGNFSDLNNTNLKYVGNGTIDTNMDEVLYYIDDVSVYYCDTIYKAEAGMNKTICEGDSVQIGLPPNADCDYKWQPTTTISNDSIANPWVKPTVTTTYYLQQIFMSNITTDSVKVTVISCEDTLKNSLTIPNAFTPNGDGVNDYLKVKGNNIRSLTGKIFNRWGEELFKFNDVNSKWDGKYNSKYVSDGVYFYIINVVFEDGETQEKHGCVELVK